MKLHFFAISLMLLSSSSYAKVNWLSITLNELTDDVLIQAKPYAILNAIRAGHSIPVIKHLINKGFDVNQGDYKNRPPICVAARSYKESTAMVEFLIQNGANPLATDINNTNALHRIAKYNPYLPLAKIFFDAGVDPLRFNKFNQSPMSLAKKYSPHLLSLFSSIRMPADPE